MRPAGRPSKHFVQGLFTIPVPANDQAHHLLGAFWIEPYHAIVGRYDRLVDELLIIFDRCFPKPKDGVASEAKALSDGVVGPANDFHDEP
jgi:hypothetical protein